MHPEKLLEPPAASFRSIAYALYKPTKRFDLFFLSPPRARRSFPRTDNDPLCLFTRPRQTFRFSFVYIRIYSYILYTYARVYTCILPAARARPFRTVRPPLHVALSCCTPGLHSRVAQAQIFRARIYRNATENVLVAPSL